MWRDSRSVSSRLSTWRFVANDSSKSRTGQWSQSCDHFLTGPPMSHPSPPRLLPDSLGCGKRATESTAKLFKVTVPDLVSHLHCQSKVFVSWWLAQKMLLLDQPFASRFLQHSARMTHRMRQRKSNWSVTKTDDREQFVCPMWSSSDRETWFC